MKKVFLIHGYGGEPNGGWRPWLMGELAKMDIWACALGMPNPDEPKNDEWINTISREVEKPNPGIFLVGHSLGATAILNYLNGLSEIESVGGVVLVSGCIRKLENDKYRQLDNFFEKPLDFEIIKSKSKHFTVIHGDNDTAVPYEQAIELSTNLDCKLISVKNGDHLSGSSGWHELPQLLEALEKMVK